MNPFVYYAIAAILFVLGLAAIGGATFGKQRNRRIVLAAAGVALWAATLLVYSQAASVAPAEPAPTPTLLVQETTPPEPPTAEPQPRSASVLTATLEAGSVSSHRRPACVPLRPGRRDRHLCGQRRWQRRAAADRLAGPRFRAGLVPRRLDYRLLRIGTTPTTPYSI